MSVTGAERVDATAERLDSEPVECRIAAYDLADGTAFEVFALDPETQEDTVESLESAFDGRVEITTVEADQQRYRLRTRGLAGRPTEWVEFSVE